MANEKRSRIQTANRAAIMAAALDVFASDGYRGATVDRIAESAGMSKPNLLYYFKSKEEIYREVLEGTLEGWLEPLEALDPDGDPLTELETYIRAKVEMARARPAESRMFANEIQRGAPLMGTFLSTRLKTLVDQKAAVIKGWMDAGALEPSDPHHLIFMIWATTQHYADFDVQVSAILQKRAKSPRFTGEVVDAVLAVLLNGVRVRPEK